MHFIVSGFFLNQNSAINNRGTVVSGFFLNLILKVCTLGEKKIEKILWFIEVFNLVLGSFESLYQLGVKK